jgi:hypothetical protein
MITGLGGVTIDCGDPERLSREIVVVVAAPGGRRTLPGAVILTVRRPLGR